MRGHEGPPSPQFLPLRAPWAQCKERGEQGYSHGGYRSPPIPPPSLPLLSCPISLPPAEGVRTRPQCIRIPRPTPIAASHHSQSPEDTTRSNRHSAAQHPSTQPRLHGRTDAEVHAQPWGWATGPPGLSSPLYPAPRQLLPCPPPYWGPLLSPAGVFCCCCLIKRDGSGAAAPSTSSPCTSGSRSSVPTGTNAFTCPAPIHRAVLGHFEKDLRGEGAAITHSAGAHSPSSTTFWAHLRAPRLCGYLLQRGVRDAVAGDAQLAQARIQLPEELPKSAVPCPAVGQHEEHLAPDVLHQPRAGDVLLQECRQLRHIWGRGGRCSGCAGPGRGAGLCGDATRGAALAVPLAALGGAAVLRERAAKGGWVGAAEGSNTGLWARRVMGGRGGEPGGGTFLVGPGPPAPSSVRSRLTRVR